MKLYKLTDENDRTYGGCQWGEGVEHTAPGTGKLCTSGWLHAYTDPLLALLLDPAHGRFGESAHLWEANGDVGKTDHGLKVGCTRIRTDRRIEKPRVSINQRVRFAILCGQEVCKDETWNHWAQKWLSGKDRTARGGARGAGHAAAHAAAVAAADAAYAGAHAAYAARGAGHAAAAYAAAHAAADGGGQLDFAALARRAIDDEKELQEAQQTHPGGGT